MGPPHDPPPVRPAGLGDLETLIDYVQRVALESEDSRPDPERVKAGLERALADPENVAAYHVAERHGIVIGCLMLTREWSDWTGAFYWWIQSVYVHPDHRGTGVFDAMYDEVRKRAQAAGITNIRLYVHKDNDAGRRAYDRVGMSETPYRIYVQDL